MLDYALRTTCRKLQLIGLSRYAFILAGLAGLGKPSIDDVVFLLIGVFLHITMYPYFGFRLCTLKAIDSEARFVPLKKWMVAYGYRELSGHEYVSLQEYNFSHYTENKMKSIFRSQGYISVYDFINLCAFEECFSGHKTFLERDDELKKHAKGKLYD